MIQPPQPPQMPQTPVAVTGPKPAWNAGAMPATNNRRLGLGLVALVALFGLWRVFGHHETSTEALAERLTAGLQANDLAAVDKEVNAETRLHLDKATVGRAADAFGPLGKLESVKETTTPGGDPQDHTFTVTFEKGTVDEKLGLDADGKVFKFHYARPITKG